MWSNKLDAKNNWMSEISAIYCKADQFRFRLPHTIWFQKITYTLITISHFSIDCPSQHLILVFEKNSWAKTEATRGILVLTSHGRLRFRSCASVFMTVDDLLSLRDRAANSAWLLSPAIRKSNDWMRNVRAHKRLPLATLLFPFSVLLHLASLRNEVKKSEL